MPFAQLVKGNVAEKGIHAMDLTTPFDQKEVLKENLTYLEKSLDVRNQIENSCPSSS